MTFGEKLLLLRKQAGLTQIELGQKAGVGRTTIIGWESGKRLPKGIEDYGPLAEALGCKPSDLMPDEFCAPVPGDSSWDHIQDIFTQAKVFFAGADIPEHDRLQFMLDIQEIYWEHKRREAEEQEKN